MRNAPACFTVKARLGASTSYKSPERNSRTRKLMLPSARRICVVFSSRLRKEREVMLARCLEACPASSTALESLSSQILSPIVAGRLRNALPHSVSPAGWKETDPSRKLMRATRVGASASSSAFTPGAARERRPANPKSSPNLPNLEKLVFISVPCFLDSPRQCAGTSQRERKRGSHLVKPQKNQEVAFFLCRPGQPATCPCFRVLELCVTCPYSDP